MLLLLLQLTPAQGIAAAADSSPRHCCCCLALGRARHSPGSGSLQYSTHLESRSIAIPRRETRKAFLSRAHKEETVENGKQWLHRFLTVTTTMSLYKAALKKNVSWCFVIDQWQCARGQGRAVPHRTVLAPASRMCDFI